MKKLGLICLGASFLSACMMESHGFVFAAPALLFGGLALIAVNIKDKPYREKNRACETVKNTLEDMAA